MDHVRSPSPTSGDVFVSTDTTKPKRPRKKNKRSSKRFLWQDDLHLRFVAAIFDLGLKNASPTMLLPLMNKANPDSRLTTEHLKSHLQKYRAKYGRSRREFQDGEVIRDRKRRRCHEESRSNAVKPYISPIGGRCNSSSTTKHATDSDSGPEGDENARNLVNVMEEGRHEMRPFSYTRELADAAAASIVATRYAAEYFPTPTMAPVASGMPEFADAQCRMFSILLPGPQTDMSMGGYGKLSVHVPQETSLAAAQNQAEVYQMHQAMQAQMNCHRQMLTRKVELSDGLYHNSDIENWIARERGVYYGASSVKEPGPSAFQQAWTRTQQIHQRQLESHRLQQQLTQFENIQMSQQRFIPGLPDAPGACGASQTVSSDLPITLAENPYADPKSDVVDQDLNHFDPFNVGLEDDELFDFLKA